MSLLLLRSSSWLAGLDAAILTDAQEDDAVDGHLHGVVELAFVDHMLVAQRDVARQQRAPLLDIRQEGIVHLGGTFFAGGIGSILIE